MTKQRFAFYVIIAVAIHAPVAMAEEGRTPIFEPIELLAANGPIQGRYVVTRNITATGQNVIRILGNGTESVDIDLNGFTLESDVNTISGGLVDRIIIRNGTVRRTGAASPQASAIGISGGSVVLETLKVTGARIALGDTDTFIIRNNVIAGTSAAGIGVSISPYSSNSSGVIEDNFVSGTASEGISVGGAEMLNLDISRNKIANTGGSGILVNVYGALTIRDNLVTLSGATGIELSDAATCSVTGNVVTLATSHGIHALTSCLVAGNSSQTNQGEGLRVAGGASQIDGNLLTGNGSWGLRFSSGGNTYGRNTVRFNSGVAAGCAVPACADLNTTDFCDTGAGNSSFGDNFAPGPGPC